MRLRPAALASAAIAACLGTVVGGCVPITQRTGFQAVDDRPQDIVAGTDTRSTVLARLGTPSATSSFPPQTYFYISQTLERTPFRSPRVTQREVVAIAFAADEKVAAVNTYGIEAGRYVNYSNRETPTRGRELTILEQLLGNVGRVNNLPNDESQTAEGRRRRDQGR